MANSTMRASMMLVATAFLSAGCGATVTAGPPSEDAGSDVPMDDRAPLDVSPPQVVLRLPEGSWSGPMMRTCSDGTTATEDCQANILDNTLRAYCEVDGFDRATLDVFSFTSSDMAIWRDLQGGELGRCVAMGSSFNCRVTAMSAAVQEVRTLTFGVITLDWSDETTAQGVTCRRSGTLVAH